MASTWEYKSIWIYLDESGNPGKNAGELKTQANEEWIALLNQLGATGWELVSERVSLDPVGRPGEFWIEYVGTMKRQGSPL